jgi:hypothetical protein
MKNALTFTTPFLALALLAAQGLHAQQYPQQQYPQQNGQYPQNGPPQQYGDRDPQRWDVPPTQFSELDRRAFHDGIDAARADWTANRPLDARRSMNYRRPPTQRNFRDEYRNSFTRGYQMAMQHRGPQDWERHDQDFHRDRDHDHDNNYPR